MKITIFVSYSHQDARYLEKNSLLGYLRGLENEDVEFWFDKKILVGEDWDSKIKSRISNAHIALVLVSQMFLDSSYCKDVEISGFLEERRTNGLIIFPIILSACEWQEHQWLRSEQFLPTGDETIEEHYVDPGRQKRLFHQIRQDLKAQIAIAREHHVARKPSDSSISDEGPSDTYPHGTVEAAETSNVTADAGQSQVPATKSTEANASEVTISSEQTKTMLPSSEDNLRKDLPKWVDRILSVRVEETGGFDGSLFEPSGSPSLWSTAQCLMGILGNGQTIVRDDVARLAFEYIKKVQKDDGGWAYSETLNETVTEVACWVTVAYAASVQAGIWKNDEDGSAFDTMVDRALKHIVSRRCSDGGWCPSAAVLPRNTRTYTTAMAAWSLFAAKNTASLGVGSTLNKDLTSAIKWLLDSRRADLGWVPNPNRRHQKDRHPGLNAEVLFILTQLENAFPFLQNVPVYKDAKRDLLVDGARWKYDFFENNTSIRDADQWLEETDFNIEGSTFLWCPWSLAALHSLTNDSELTDEERRQAVKLRAEMIEKIQKCGDDVGTSGTWELAETLFCAGYALR